MRCRAGLASRERVPRELVELAEFVVEAIIGQHRAAELADELVEGNEGAGAIDGHQFGDWVAVDGDAQSLACFHASQQAGGVVSQLPLWNLCSPRATE